MIVRGMDVVKKIQMSSYEDGTAETDEIFRAVGGVLQG